MSDTMLRGVLRMPFHLAMGDAISSLQFYERAQEALKRMELAEAALTWQPIETAPEPWRGKRPMFVVCAFDVRHESTGGRPYTSDPWCSWRLAEGGFARWPHQFQPTHWMPLPPPPQS